MLSKAPSRVFVARTQDPNTAPAVAARVNISCVVCVTSYFQGDKGDMGQEGDKGEKGETGLKGKEGHLGSAGLTGVRVSGLPWCQIDTLI